MAVRNWKYKVAIDFDGVLHSYESGWHGVGVADDPPVPGAIMWLIMAALDDQIEVMIFSARSKSLRGRRAMRRFLFRHIADALAKSDSMVMGEFFEKLDPDDYTDKGMAEALMRRIKFPWFKGNFHIFIDDRAFAFNGRFPDLDQLKLFKPWNKRPEFDPEEYTQRVLDLPEPLRSQMLLGSFHASLRGEEDNG